MEPIRSYFEPQHENMLHAEQVQYNSDVYRLMHRVAQRIDFQVRLALGPIPQLPTRPESLLIGLRHHKRTGLIFFQSKQVNLLYKDVCNGTLYILRNQLPDASFVSSSVSLFVLYQLGKTFRIRNFIQKITFEEMYNEGLIVELQKLKQ